MTQPAEAPSVFDTFTTWAKAQKIFVCDGIAPGKIGKEGEGSGIFARRTITPGERLVFVPATALLTTNVVVTRCIGDSNALGNSTPLRGNAHDHKLPLRECSAHALLAAYLTRTSNDDELAAWRATWSRDEDLNVLPARWSTEVREMLPGEAPSLAQRQRRRMDRDWQLMKHWIYHDLDRSHESSNVKALFGYHWLIINTRTFYWPHANKLTKLRETWKTKDSSRGGRGSQVGMRSSSPARQSMKKREVAEVDVDMGGSGDDVAVENEDRPSEECLAMCPWADLFNHTDEGFASATYDRDGYTVTALRSYKRGEEIFVNYGAHGNDYLLAEYGFILPSNTDDSHSLDTLILPHLTPEQGEILKDTGYYRKYNLSFNPPYLCFRTHALLTLLALCPATGSNADQSDKFQPYHTFINTAEHASSSERRTIAETTLRLLLNVLSEKCEHQLARLEANTSRTQRDRFRVRRRDMRISRLNCDGQVDDDDENDDGDDEVLNDVQRMMLKSRWTQISAMVARAVRSARREIEMLDSLRRSEKRSESRSGSGNGSGSRSGSRTQGRNRQVNHARVGRENGIDKAESDSEREYWSANEVEAETEGKGKGKAKSKAKAKAKAESESESESEDEDIDDDVVEESGLFA